MNKWIERILCLVIFIVCIALIVTGQRTIGVRNLLQMLVGLAGVLGLLFYYNKRHQ